MYAFDVRDQHNKLFGTGKYLFSQVFRAACTQFQYNERSGAAFLQLLHEMSGATHFPTIFFLSRRLSFWQIHVCTHSVSPRLTERCHAMRPLYSLVEKCMRMDELPRYCSSHNNSTQQHAYTDLTNTHQNRENDDVFGSDSVSTYDERVWWEFSFLRFRFLCSVSAYGRSSAVNSKWSSLRLSFFRDARKCSVRFSQSM